MTYSTNVPLTSRTIRRARAINFLLRAVRLDERSQRHHLSRRHTISRFTSGIPNDDDWGSIHWGHARSTNPDSDWEHLPFLKPDRSLGEPVFRLSHAAQRAASYDSLYRHWSADGRM